MPNVMKLDWADCHTLAYNVAADIMKIVQRHNIEGPIHLYGVPRGGVIAATLVLKQLHFLGVNQALLTDSYEHKALNQSVNERLLVIIDDIIDSGATERRWFQKTHGATFLALWNKQNHDPTEWVEFPWERMDGETGPQENIRRILEYIGEDPKREGLLETPDRVVKSYAELFSGYKADVKSVFKTFENCAKYDEMVILNGVEFYSFCEHHMLPFTGTMSIAYLPKDRIIGLSKLARLAEVYSRRLQVQERLTTDITNALNEYLGCIGSACIVKAKHFCMCARGVGKQHSTMTTSSLTGVFREPEVRAELLRLIEL